jgi:Na+/proline symporter
MSIYAIIMVIYFIGMLLIGLLTSRQAVTSTEEFMIANHSLGLIPSIGTMTATLFHAVNFIGWTGWLYVNGWSSNWQIGGSILSMLLLILLAGRFRQIKFTTVPDYIRAKYNEKAEVLSAVLYIVDSIIAIIVQTLGMAVAVSAFLGVPLSLSIWLSVIIVGAYTIMGGFLAVAYTDVVQIGIAIVGFILAVVLALNNVGGFTQMNLEIAKIDKKLIDAFALGSLSIGSIIGFQILWGLTNMVQGQVFVRISAPKTTKIARISVLCAAIMWYFTYVYGNPILGLSARIMFPGITKPDMVFPTLIKMTLPPIAAALVLCGIVAAVMSTCDSILLFVSTVFVKNIVMRAKKLDDKKAIFLSRVTILVISVLAGLGAQTYPATIQWINIYRQTLIGSSITIPLLLGALWNPVPESGFWSMIVGAVTGVTWWHTGWKVFSGLHPIIVGLCSALILMIVWKLVAANRAKLQESEMRL